MVTDTISVDKSECPLQSKKYPPSLKVETSLLSGTILIKLSLTGWKFKLSDWVGQFRPTQLGNLNFLTGWNRIVPPSWEI